MRLITAVSSLAPLLSICLLGLTHLPQASAECCFEAPLGVCGDCSPPTPYCGYGPCNIFGCNCDGGCREGSCDRQPGKADAEQTPDDSEKEIPDAVNQAAAALRDEVCDDDMKNMDCAESMADMLKEAQIW